MAIEAQTSGPARAPSSTGAEPVRLSGFRGLVDPAAGGDFVQGGFPTADGSFWPFREPDAVVVVEPGLLRVRIERLSRRHDEVQFLDNAKHMYFSRRRVATPESGEVRLELPIRARISRGRDDDLYAGFVSLNLLDFSTGMALDWFVSNRIAATVYARLPFPGAPAPADDPSRPRYFCVFNEVRHDLTPGSQHRYGIAYERSAGRVRFLLDGEEVDRYDGVPSQIDAYSVALGCMTEKPIGEGGSVSCFGQGISAEYGAIEVTGSAGLV
ncbi:MAG: hypothetical protein NVSMB29_04000 [Candidatus Dormibacteria bacterium]